MGFLDLEINQKNYIKILCICILVVILILVAYYITLLIPTKFVLKESTKVVSFEQEENLIVHIDMLAPLELTPQDNKIEIAGYAYLIDDEVFTVDCSYVLRNKDSGEMYFLKTRHEKNENVPEVYPYAGMHTRFMIYGIKNGNYEICVLYRNNENDILKGTGINIEI